MVYKVTKSYSPPLDIWLHDEWEKRKEEGHIESEPGVEYINKFELETRFGLKDSDLNIIESTHAKELNNYLIDNNYSIEKFKLKNPLELSIEEDKKEWIKDLLG